MPICKMTNGSRLCGRVSPSSCSASLSMSRPQGPYGEKGRGLDPAHAQFIARKASDPPEETRALSETHVGQSALTIGYR